MVASGTRSESGPEERIHAELAREVGLSTNTRYLGTMFTRTISHTAYFDTFAKRKILGLAPEKYVVLADRANIGNAAYVECWRAHCDIIGDPHALLCTAALCFCDLEVQCFRSNDTH